MIIFLIINKYIIKVYSKVDNIANKYIEDFITK